MTPQELCVSLRKLADFYDQHPDFPVPYELENPMFVFLYGMELDRVKEIIRSLGSFEKRYDQPSSGSFDAIKTVGEFRLMFHTDRENICQPRVVGKKKIPRQVIPPTPEEVIEEHEVDIVEWDCAPILR